MKCVRLEVNLYEGGPPTLEVVLDGYDADRSAPWENVDKWMFEAGDPFLLGEAVSHFEMLADAIARSVGLQLALPFE